MSCCLKNYAKKTVVLTPLTPLTPLTSVLAKLELRIKRSLFGVYFCQIWCNESFFRFVGRFFEIKTLPLHKNNGDVLPSLWV